jgi:hypothetical protein
MRKLYLLLAFAPFALFAACGGTPKPPLEPSALDGVEAGAPDMPSSTATAAPTDTTPAATATATTPPPAETAAAPVDAGAPAKDAGTKGTGKPKPKGGKK